MKYCTLICFAISLLLGSDLLAQQGLKVGLVGGPQLGYALNEYDQSLEGDMYQRVAKWGVFGGAMVGYHFLDEFGVQVQFIYSQQGNAFTQAGGQNGEIRRNETLEYFKIPLLLSYNTPTFNNKVRFAIQAGPQVSFLTGAQQYVDDPSLELLPDPSVTRIPGDLEVYEPFLWGMLAEAGVDIDLSPFVLTIRLRQDMHFQDQENKDATVRVNSATNANILPYWNFFRGPAVATRPITQGWASGLRLGLVYTFN